MGKVFYTADRDYPEPWDGNRNGGELRVATYYYVINMNDGLKAVVGSVTLVK